MPRGRRGLRTIDAGCRWFAQRSRRAAAADGEQRRLWWRIVAGTGSVSTSSRLSIGSDNTPYLSDRIHCAIFAVAVQVATLIVEFQAVDHLVSMQRTVTGSTLVETAWESVSGVSLDLRQFGKRPAHRRLLVTPVSLCGTQFRPVVAPIWHADAELA